MALGGYAAGGISQGFGEQEKQNLADRTQNLKEKTVEQAQIQKQISDTLAVVKQITSSATDAGKDPQTVAKAVMPIIDSATDLATSGFGPEAGQRVRQMGLGYLSLTPYGAAPAAPAAATAAPAPAAGPTGPVTDSQIADFERRTNVPMNQRTGGDPIPVSPSLPLAPPVGFGQGQLPPVAPPPPTTPNERVGQTFGNERPQPASMVTPDATPVVPAGAPGNTGNPEKDAEDTINFTHLVPLPEGITLKGGQTMTPRAIREAAIQVALGNTAPLTRMSETTRAAIKNDAADINTAMKRSGADVNASNAEYKANTAALTDLAKKTAAIGSFERTAIKNGDVLVDLAKKVDSTGVPVIERWLRAGKQAAGDPDVAEFMFQMNLFRSEVAKITTNPNLAGVLTDEARKEVEAGLPNASSSSQIERIVRRAKNDFQNRKDAVGEEYADVRSRFGFPKPVKQQSAPTELAPVQQPSHIIVTPGGGKFRIGD